MGGHHAVELGLGLRTGKLEGLLVLATQRGGTLLHLMDKLVVAHLANDTLVIALIEIDDRPALRARNLVHMRSSLRRNARVRPTHAAAYSLPSDYTRPCGQKAVRPFETGRTGCDTRDDPGCRTRLPQLQSPFEYDHILQLNSSFNDRVIVILNEEVRQHMRTREATRLVKGNGQRTVACTDPQYVVLAGRMLRSEFQERPANTAALMRRIDGKAFHLGHAKPPSINALIRHNHAPERANGHERGISLGAGLILRIRREHLTSVEVKLDHVPLLVGEQKQAAILLTVAVDRFDAHCWRHALLQRARMDHASFYRASRTNTAART